MQLQTEYDDLNNSEIRYLIKNRKKTTYKILKLKHFNCCYPHLEFYVSKLQRMWGFHCL